MDEICFAQLESGAEVAYRVVSDADGPTIVHIPGGTTPIEVLSDDPMYDRFLRTLGRYGRLIVFDRPGVGASDAFEPDRLLTEQNAEAFVAVLDAVGAESAWIAQKSAYIARHLASEHRARIDGAALLADWRPAALVEWARGLDRMLSRSSDADSQAFVPNPSRADDPSYLAWHERAGRIGASAAEARALYTTGLEQLRQFVSDGAYPFEITEPLPVAVVHRRQSASSTLEDAEWWVDQFAGAELILLDGVDDGIEGIDAGTLADVMGTFITGERAASDDDRPLAAILFCDLVESTGRAASAGDTTWKSTLDLYERHVASVVDRHHGTLVKFTGDGALATFRSGSRAMSAANDLRAGTRELGLEDRIGIHLGEVEQRQDDIGGLAVHLAARVMGCAEPGQVLVSSAIAQTTLGSRFELAPVGPHDLKGFDHPWELFALRHDTG